SLGCTLYYLLTGKPPFGSGPLAIKLMRHQQAEPPDLCRLRPEVPRKLAALARRMLAKRPNDRFRTPGEVASAIAALYPPAGAPQVTETRTGESTLLSALALRVARPRLGRWLWMMLGGIGLLLLLLAVFWFWPAKNRTGDIASIDKSRAASP